MEEYHELRMAQLTNKTVRIGAQLLLNSLMYSIAFPSQFSKCRTKQKGIDYRQKRT